MTSIRKRRARRLIVLAGMQVVTLAGGVAFADWVASGTGNAYAKARRAVALTTSVATAGESLYPGGTGDVVLTINNPNPFPVTVRSITGNGAITSGVATCDTPGNGVTFADQTGTWPIGGSASITVTLSGAVSMAATSPDACQGATFTIPVRASSDGSSGPTTSAAALQLSPTSVAFGTVPVGQTSSASAVTVTNAGGATGSALTVTSASGFPIDSNGCVGPLATGQSCTVQIRFAPTTSGAQTGTLTVAVPGSTVTATLTGTGGTTAQLTVSPSSLSFPSTNVGAASATLAFTIMNAGGAQSGSPVLSPISGPNPTDFVVASNGCGAPLAPGASCLVVMRFAPTAGGPRVASISVAASPGATAPLTVSLSGTGTLV